MDVVYAVLGLVILLLAGDALVRGAVNLSLRLGVPALIVSLTIVAFGTSAPELLIAIQALLEDAPGIALGNVVGSNTANVLLVLGVPALMTGLDTSKSDSRRSYIEMVVITLIFIGLCYFSPIFGIDSFILLAILFLILANHARHAVTHYRETGEAMVDEEEELEGADPDLPGWKIGIFLVLGLIGLPLGADLLVEGSVGIARDIGVSETVIGLTLVALGTSLPELATTVVAALRRQAAVALGNVIGSNVFNLLGIIGVASFFDPIPVGREFLERDLWVMLGATLLIAPFVFSNKMNLTRGWGVLFCALYVIYIVAVVK